MVRLTEEMIAARTRVNDVSGVKKLNCWGTELTDVSILRKMKKVEVLSLSVNNIKTLADFQNCTDLKDLFVRKNNIKDLNEVCYLQGLPCLRNLWLGENPCAEIEGYRQAVLRALPQLEKLDDKVVTPEEVQTALLKGKVLVHPMTSIMQESGQSSPHSTRASPEDGTNKYLDDPELNQRQNYSSDEDQRSDEGQDEYQDTDKRNANYNSSPVHQYPPNNRYMYEQNGQIKTDNNVHNNIYKEDTVASNILDTQQDYNERSASKRNGDYEDPRLYSSPRGPYQTSEYDDRRIDYEETPRPVSAQSRRGILHQSDKDDQSPGWTKRLEKDKRRAHFQYQRRPVTRNSNILSAVLCLVKELDYPSLEVLEVAIRSRMDELEE